MHFGFAETIRVFTERHFRFTESGAVFALNKTLNQNLKMIFLAKRYRISNVNFWLICMLNIKKIFVTLFGRNTLFSFG